MLPTVASDEEEKARRRAEGVKLDAYLARGIEVVGPYPNQRIWEASGPAWDPDWLMSRLVGPDHIRYMLRDGRLVGVLTQPYDQLLDLASQAGKLNELRAAGFDVDVCMHCSPRYPGHTLAIIHYRPGDNPSGLHLPHG